MSPPLRVTRSPLAGADLADSMGQEVTGEVHELIDEEGLGDERGDPDLARLFTQLRGVVGGEQDHGRGEALLLQERDQRQPVHAAQIIVGQHEIVGLAVPQFQALFSRDSVIKMVGLFENTHTDLDDLVDAAVVFDQEDA